MTHILGKTKNGKSSFLQPVSMDNDKIYLVSFVIVNIDIAKQTYCGCILSTEKVYDLVIMFDKHLSICRAVKLYLLVMLKYLSHRREPKDENLEQGSCSNIFSSLKDISWRTIQ